MKCQKFSSPLSWPSASGLQIEQIECVQSHEQDHHLSLTISLLQILVNKRFSLFLSFSLSLSVSLSLLPTFPLERMSESVRASEGERGRVLCSAHNKLWRSRARVHTQRLQRIQSCRLELETCSKRHPSASPVRLVPARLPGFRLRLALCQKAPRGLRLRPPSEGARGRRRLHALLSRGGLAAGVGAGGQ